MNREIMVQAAGMRKANMPTSFVSAMLLALVSLVMVTDASANSAIFGKAASKGIKVTTCTSCHTTAAGPVLKPYFQAAYNLDKVNLVRLKNLINGCAFGQALSKTTFLCQAPISKAGTVGLAGSGLAKTDVYKVTCATGAAALFVAVKDLVPVKLPLLSIQAKKLTASSVLSIDIGVDGNAIYSPLKNLVKGAGVYTVNVNKPAYTGTLAAHKGAEAYTALFSCRNSVGTQLGTTVVLGQNQ